MCVCVGEGVDEYSVSRVVSNTERMEQLSIGKRSERRRRDRTNRLIGAFPTGEITSHV